MRNHDSWLIERIGSPATRFAAEADLARVELRQPAWEGRKKALRRFLSILSRKPIEFFRRKLEVARSSAHKPGYGELTFDRVFPGNVAYYL